MDPEVAPLPHPSFKVAIGLLALLILGVLAVVGVGLALGPGVMETLAEGDTAPDRLRDNAQLQIAKTIEARGEYIAINSMTLKAGASSGVGTVQAGLAEAAGNTEAAHLWLALDAAGREMPRLAEAHRGAAGTAGGGNENRTLRANFGKLLGWAAISANNPKALADWNEMVGKGIKE